MSKKNKNKNNNNKQKLVSQQLNEDASLRLKFFIEDLKHDPQFRHRLFYPVLYKEVVRGMQYVDKNNNVKMPTAEVKYEYYLLKMEKYGEDNTAKLVQAILFANGPMLPKNERFMFTEANEPNSLLNTRNVRTVINRTKTFIEVLQDDNLFNFIFNNIVGNNLESMRKKFSKLAAGNQHNAGRDIAAAAISNDDKISERIAKNTNALRDYFEHINTRDITNTVNFLTYMGNPRNIVTDFNYRPMPQDMLDRYSSYGMTDEDNALLELRSQLEQALDSQVLSKDLASQMDSFIPMVLREYLSVCLDREDIICASNKSLGADTDINHMDYGLKNNIKLKLQRSLKQIADYTKNYLTRKLLDTTYNNQLFISRVLNTFVNEIDNLSVADITRRELTFDNFISSPGDDLSDLISSIFENDITYIYEICSNTNNCREARRSFAAAWDLAKHGNMDEQSYIASFKNEMTGNILPKLSRCFTSKDKDRESIARNLVNTVKDRSGNAIINNRVVARARDDAAQNFRDNIENALERMRDYTVAERVASSIFSSMQTLITNALHGATSRNPEQILLTIIYIMQMHHEIGDYLTASINKLSNADTLDEIRDILVQIVAVANATKTINKQLKDIEKSLKDVFRNSRCSRNNDCMSVYTEFNKYMNNINVCLTLLTSIKDSIETITLDNNQDFEDLKVKLKNSIRMYDSRSELDDISELVNHMLELYFKFYLRPVLINFFGYALDTFEYTSRKDAIEDDIISKDILHFSKILTPSNAGLLTIDGAVIHDIAKFTYILMSDTFSGITYNNPDSVMDFLNKVYGIKYFNVIIYGTSDAYVYMNNIGTPYLYRGAKTKIPIRDLRRNYDFLMDASQGLYKNISLPRKK